MQVRIFEAEDMNTGLRLIRKELGPDALILSTKTVKNGKLGLLGKSTVEITAAIDKPWPEKPSTRSVHPTSHQRNIITNQALPVSPRRINHTINDDISISYQDVQQEQKETRQMLTSPNAVERLREDALRSEVNELKNLVQQLAGQMARPSSPQQAPKPARVKVEQQIKPPPVNQDIAEPTLPTRLPKSEELRQRLGSVTSSREPILKLLRDHGIEGEPALVISDYAKDCLTPHDIANPESLRRFVVQAIEDLLDVVPPDFENSDEQTRIALIGPTGVGKTTTLAKLAALYLTNYSDSIALITIDTYRIAAVEQIKVYGEIMHLPVDVVISPEQLEEALARHRDKKLILIDTAGRSPKDTLSVIELSLFLRPDLNIQKHLVLSAGTRESELLDTINRFEKVGIDRTIFTKVDECSQNGIILNIQTNNNAPLSYITNGQRVPEDLLQITRRSMAEFIMTADEGTSHE